MSAGFDADLILILGAILFFSCLGPLLLFYLFRKFLNKKLAKILCNIIGILGLVYGVFTSIKAVMVGTGVVTGGVAGVSGSVVMILILPFTILLVLTSLFILVRTNRKQ